MTVGMPVREGQVWLVRTDRVPGDAFKLYLLAYALCRFGIEFVRDNLEMALGLRGSQIFLLLTIPTATFVYLWRRTRQPRLVLEPA